MEPLQAINSNGYFIEIAVLSYGRPNELKRLLLNFINYKNPHLLITVREDLSPQRDEIAKVCRSFSERTDFFVDINLVLNEKNIGYDLNLLASLDSSVANYLMLLSDDDCIDIAYLDDFINFVRTNSEDLCFIPAFRKGLAVHRLGNRLNCSAYNIDTLYNSILFSGITIKTDGWYLSASIREELAYSIYTQVYLVAKISSASKIFYYEFPLVIAYEDGENYFGISDSTKNQVDLSDRSDLLSNFQYQKRLKHVVQMVSRDIYPGFYATFFQELNYRAIAQFLKARGRCSFFSYVKLLCRFVKFDFRLYLLSNVCIYGFVLVPSLFAKAAYLFFVNKYRKSGG